jgi:hypothetical protein
MYIFYLQIVPVNHCLILMNLGTINLSVNCQGLCIIRDINTVFFERINSVMFGNPNLFYRLQKRLCTRLAIPSRWPDEVKVLPEPVVCQM